MNPLVFECPLCHTPFQALATMAGTAVQCPNCAGAIKLPTSIGNAIMPEASAPPAAPSLASDVLSLDCPKCKRAFGYTREMMGQTIACPHCQDRFALEAEMPKPTAESSPSSILGLPPDSQRNRFRGYRPPKAQAVAIPAPAIRSMKPLAETELAATVATSRSDLGSGLEKNENLAPEKREQETRVLDPSNLGDSEPGHESGEIHVNQKKSNKTQGPSTKPSLLPPKFSSTNPALIRHRKSRNEPFVLLPTAQGGYQRVNSAIVRIEHDGETILLTTPDSARVRRRRMIINLVTVIVCGSILYFAFRWLLN